MIDLEKPLKIEFGIEPPKARAVYKDTIEYHLGTKLDAELVVGSSYLAFGINSKKLKIRLKRIDVLKEYSIYKELGGYRVFRIK